VRGKEKASEHGEGHPETSTFCGQSLEQEEPIRCKKWARGTVCGKASLEKDSLEWRFDITLRAGPGTPLPMSAANARQWQGRATQWRRTRRRARLTCRRERPVRSSGKTGPLLESDFLEGKGIRRRVHRERRTVAGTQARMRNDDLPERSALSKVGRIVAREEIRMTLLRESAAASWGGEQVKWIGARTCPFNHAKIRDRLAIA